MGLTNLFEQHKDSMNTIMNYSADKFFSTVENDNHLPNNSRG